MENNPGTAEEKAAAQKKAKNEEYCRHLNLEAYTPETKFMEIDYAGKEVSGRTVIALGAFSMHIRSAGHKKGQIWNENLALFETGEQNFDVLMIRLRHDVCGIDLTRRPRQGNEIQPLIEGHDSNPESICHLVISFREGGTYEINGLPEDLAIQIRKIIYQWISSLY